MAAIAVLLLRGLTLASRFLLSVLLARMLSPDAMGDYGLITATLAFALLGLGLEFYSHTIASWFRQARSGASNHREPVRSRRDRFCRRGAGRHAGDLAGLFSARLASWFLLILATEHLSLEATRILIITSRPVRAYLAVFLRGGIWVYAIAMLMLSVSASVRSKPSCLVGAWRRASVLFAAFSLRDLPWREFRAARIGHGSPAVSASRVRSC